MCQATRLLDQMLLTIRPLPPNPVREHLCRLGYTSVAIVDVLCHIERTGSPRCESLEEEDVSAIEGMLDDHGCVDGCRECADEAAVRRQLLRESGAQKQVDDSDLNRTEGF
jgi:hypothetical protein